MICATVCEARLLYRSSLLLDCLAGKMWQQAQNGTGVAASLVVDAPTLLLKSVLSRCTRYLALAMALDIEASSRS
jgi:hypothetical protein